MAKKRKNKALPMIVLICILIVLIIAYSALSAANDRREAEELAAEEAANATVLIAEYDYTTATKLSYTISGSDKLTFLQSAGVWSYADDAHFPLDQTTVASMAAAISTIGIDTEVSEGSAADYGLDAPAYTIEISYSDGTSHTYKIGDYNSFNDAYYFSMDGDLYMVASALTDYFDYELGDLMKLDTIPTSDWAELGYVNGITVTNGADSASITDGEAKEEIIGRLGDIRLTECADYYADESEKAAYGFDGSASVRVNYKKAVTTTDADGNSSTSYLDTSWALMIGAPVGHNEGYYACPENSDIVYIIGEEEANELLSYAAYVPAPAEEE